MAPLSASMIRISDRPTTTERVVWERPFCRLIAFDRAFPTPPAEAQPKLLIVAPMSGHFATLLRGGKVVVVDGYQPQLLANIVETEMVHYLTVIPGMIMDFIEVLKQRKVRPKFIGMIGAMADLVPRQQLAEITTLLHAPYLNTFGSTETGMPPATGNYVAIGVAPTSLSKQQNDLCEIRLVDPDDNDVPDGEPGELGDGDEGALRTEAREGLPHRPVQSVLLDARDDFLDAPLLVQAAVHEVPRHLD